MDKKEIISILEEIAVLLDLKGANPFKSRAYEKAARALKSSPEDITKLAKEDELQRLSGIGEGISKKIKELVATGELEYYNNLKEEIPAGLIKLTEIPSLGPKKVKTLYEKLEITSLGELEYACKENRIATLQGFGAKSQKNILEGIQFLKEADRKFLYSEAEAAANKIIDQLSDLDEIKKISTAGSLRRKKETIGDVDVLVAADEEDRDKIADYYCGMDGVKDVEAKGKTKSTIILEGNISADLRIVKRKQFPFALHYFTGSKAHNIAMRSITKDRDIKMNEYGLFKNEDELIECEDEKDIFETLSMDYIPPELRENTGEIEAAQEGNLPNLVTDADIKGVLHVHTVYSDGSDTPEEIIEECIKMGFDYIGFAEHSQTANYANGLTSKEVSEYIEKLRSLNEEYSQIEIFAGIESDILEDGSLDYSEEVLKSFDFIVGSVHSKLRSMDIEEATRRITTALKNPYLSILGHPTGRLLTSREEYPLNMDQVLGTAAKYGKMIELNCNPHRFDLDWRFGKKAKQLGIKLVLAPDAHEREGLHDVYYGVGIARKGWQEKENILNSYSAEEAKELLQSSSTA